MNPARTLGPDIIAGNYTGWWVYIAGPVIGAFIAIMIIQAVRGLPDKDEREAAEGGALPILGRPSGPGAGGRWRRRSLRARPRTPSTVSRCAGYFQAG